MSDHQLRSHPSGIFAGYDVDVDPSVSNVFAASAFRMGHSQVPPELARYDVNYEKIVPDVPYHEAYFNATYLYDVENGGVDAIIRGMTVAKLPKVDGYLATAVIHHLFADPKNG